MSTKYYKRIDLIRVLACIAILFYHIGILKGGYLAVCTFFVLSGYLGVISCFNKKKIDLKEYYINKLKRIYLPLIVVVFLSIAIVSLIPSINWLNLKPETTSVLLGYNNFWQLNANLDYFVRHISSPFIHLWYIAILIQFEIVFPLIFMTLKKIGKKVSKIVPCLILGILGIVSYIFFYKEVKDGNLMSAYYGTFTRSFSLFAGLLLGFIHSYYEPVTTKNKKMNRIAFTAYLLLLFLLFFIVDVNSSLFNLGMIATTLISMRLIDYATVELKKENIDEIISSLSKVSYEIYLVQYPVIFLLQNISMPFIIRVILIVIITVILSYIINLSLRLKKKKLLNIFLCTIVTLTSIFGFYKYVAAKDHTAEMKKLEKDLDKNRKLIEEKQKEYEKNLQNEKNEWEEYLNNLDNDEEHIKELVTNLKIVGIGDSIMELTVKDLYKVFPNGYFDGLTNRTEKATYKVVDELKSKNMLGDVVLLSVGTNGQCLGKCKEDLIEKFGDRKIFWLTATNPDYDTFNPSIIKAAEEHSNIHIIDWGTYGKEHLEYLISDRVHPNVKGCKVFAEFIYNAIYQQYLEEYRNKKEELIKEHEEKTKERITFIGNDLLLGLFDYIKDDYSKDEFIIDKEFTYKTVKEKIEKEIEDNKLAYNVVLTFDSKMNLTKKEYNELIELCKDHKVYIITNDNLNIDKDNVEIIKYNSKEKGYTLIDGIHLTEKGNNALKEIINKSLKKSGEDNK